jgi:hypothetical protein
MFAPVVCLTFYSPSPDNYIVTHGPTGGPRIAKPLCSSQGIKCQYSVMMARVVHGVPRPVGLATW